MTLIDEARNGITPEIAEVAKKENMEPERLRRAVVDGRVVIPRNVDREFEPIGIGEGLRVKINVNIGTSKDHVDVEEEIAKAEVAMKYGTDTIMDLSTGGDIDAIRKMIVQECQIPLGTVPIYQAAIARASADAIVNMTEDDMFSGVEKHARDGVDFMTVHCGVTRQSVEKLQEANRLTGVVSRGGAFLTAWILHNDQENPFYSNFDYLLELSKEHDITLSLGDGLRPGCINDASDAAQIQELLIMGKLVERCRDAGVQCMIEGPGHVPINEIEANVRLQKKVCKGAPFYVLGPLVTDVAPGYDHITGAIGGALAAYYGADYLCYVTPSEHLSLPTVEDVKEGTIASRIAAHAADLARGKDAEWDNSISRARAELDWDGQFKYAIDKEKAVQCRESRKPTEKDTCSMCGDLCAIKMVKDHMKKDADAK
jgi:phosphomethylpyrimidine synthase